LQPGEIEEANMTHRLPTRAQAARCIGVALGAAALLTLTTALSHADDGDARKILKSMTDYVTTQKSFALTFDSDIEVLTLDLQKVQFTASGSLLVDRTAGVRARRTGGYADVELVSDGKSVIVYNNPGKMFARIDMPGSFDEVVGLLRTEHSVEIPGADLFLTKSYELLTEGVVDAKHIGRGVVDGVECEHLAFRTRDTDWQLWVDAGQRPMPRKYVITSKNVSHAPQYTLRIKEMLTNVNPDASAFVFQAPAGVRQVALDALGDIDEVPPGSLDGGSKP
jgi:hypothetical protein